MFRKNDFSKTGQRPKESTPFSDYYSTRENERRRDKLNKRQDHGSDLGCLLPAGKLLVRSFFRRLSEKRCLGAVTSAEERVKSGTLWKDE